MLVYVHLISVVKLSADTFVIATSFTSALLVLGGRRLYQLCVFRINATVTS